MSDNLDFNKTRYTHRDYESLRKDLISIIPSLTQKWTSTEESDPGIVLIKLISMLGDNLSYNMDKMALEMYLDSVTQRKNCRKILSLLGYKMHWYRSARVTATVRNMISVGNSADNGTNITLTPWETTFKSGSLQYVMISEPGENTQNVFLPPLGPSKSINLVEGVVNTARFKGSNLQKNRYYFTKSNIDESYIRLLVDNGGALVERGVLVDNLYLVGDNDAVYFEFGVDEYDTPYIELIDFWKSLVGENADFVVQYIVTNGSKGNITDNAFDLIQYGNGSVLYINNLTNNTENSLDPYNAPGRDPQTPSDARKESANYVFTYDTLVSASDFEKATRRFAGIYNSKLVDGEIIKLDNLNLHEILYRKNDNTEFEDYLITEGEAGNLTYRMLPYIVIMYLIHQNFTYNEYVGSDDTSSQEAFYEDVSNAFQEYDEEDEDYTGQSFFPYKPKDSVLDEVEIGVRDNKIMNVELHWGTTKVFPFKVDGTLYFIEPLDPSTIIYIIDTLIVDALQLHFRPDNRSYGQKPTFLEIVDVIQGADDRIKYFDAETSLIDWVLTGDTAPVFDTTSFAKYQGLAETFNVDSKYLRFQITNTTNEDITLYAPRTEDAIDVRKGYEDIDFTIKAYDTAYVTCANIPQVRTLAYWINTNNIVYVNGGNF